jgi:ATP-dependent RNA helicase RhlE
MAIPAVLNGRDVMGLAQTGTGKTAAFLLPIIAQLLKRPEAQRRTGRKARLLVLAPTRELAEQIHEAALDLAKNTGLRSTTVYGGVSMNRQINALRNGADIIVACPGRLLDHMGQRTVDLSGIEHLVLDEADQMFDMGFFPDIKKVLAGLPKERQTMLFSATMPEAIRSLAADILKDPETLRVNHNAPTETVSHAIYPVAHHLKTKLLLEILRRNQQGSVLVFTRTKHRAKRLAENLDKAGHKSTALQGNLSQNRRKEAMDGFRSGRYRVLVATDIAARGIDVNLVTHVVNFDVPSTPETYTHRIGRTGRAERTGEAHTFVTGEDVSMVRAIERLMREPLTRKKIEASTTTSLPARLTATSTGPSWTVGAAAGAAATAAGTAEAARPGTATVSVRSRAARVRHMARFGPKKRTNAMWTATRPARRRHLRFRRSRQPRPAWLWRPFRQRRVQGRPQRRRRPPGSGPRGQQPYGQARRSGQGGRPQGQPYRPSAPRAAE